MFLLMLALLYLSPNWQCWLLQDYVRSHVIKCGVGLINSWTNTESRVCTLCTCMQSVHAPDLRRRNLPSCHARLQLRAAKGDSKNRRKVIVLY